jgi:hypothetical protein
MLTGAVAAWVVGILTGWSAIVPADLADLIIGEGKPAEIRFTGAEANTSVPFELRNYTGTKVEEGSVEADADGAFVVKIQPGAGFYELVFSSQNTPIGLMVLKPVRGNPDPFFCIDTAMSWHGRKAAMDGYMAMLKRMDLGLARERYSWISTNPAPGKINLEPYQSHRERYRQHGLSILECFHDAPGWIIGEAAKAQGVPYPQDMVETVNFWKSAAETLGPSWGAMEVWNEPELMGGKLPPDQYLPTVKAVRYALHAASPSTPIVAGVFCSLIPAFLDQAALNGLLEECDVASYHYYEHSGGVLDDVEKRRYWMKKFGHESKPLWITEAGGVMESPQGKAPTLQQQAQSALMICSNAAEFKACGIDRYFAFLYVYFLQGDKDDFGMLARNHTPRRSLAAYAQMARLLGNATYIGDLPIGDPRSKLARVFQVDDQSALALVTTGTVNASTLIRLPVAVQEVRGIDGRLLEKKSDTVIPVPDGLSYVKVSLDELEESLVRDTRAMKLWQVSRQPAEKLPPPSPIILQPLLDFDHLKSTTRGYYLAQGGETFEIKAKVSNVSSEDIETTVQIGTDAPVKVKVPAQSSVEIPATVDVAKLPVNDAWISQLKITATAPGVEQITPAVVWINVPRGIETYLEGCSYRYELPISDASRWSSNAASSGRLQEIQSLEAPYGFTASFDAANQDRWAFPKFSIPVEADLDQVTGVLVRARCQKPAKVRLMTWYDDDRFRFTDFPIIKADGEWQVAYISLESFLSSKDGKPKLGKRLSVGLNTEEDTNTLEISDIFLIGRKQETPKPPAP